MSFLRSILLIGYVERQRSANKCQSDTISYRSSSFFSFLTPYGVKHIENDNTELVNGIA